MESYSKKKGKKVILLIGIIIIWILMMPFIRTMIATEIYSIFNKSNSEVAKTPLRINVPSGEMTEKKDWFPNMVWFHDPFYGQDDIDITVLYSYGDFNHIFGTSSYYDQDSKYYGSFYGAYLIKNKADNIFGFQEDGKVNIGQIMRVTAHDQKNLVLPALGCERSERVFDVIEMTKPEKVQYIGYDDWMKVDSQVVTNGPAHTTRKFYRGYLQYGFPMKPNQDSYDFEPKKFYGRIYVRYFEEYKTTVCLYMMCYDKNVLEETDLEILQKSIIK